MSFADLTAFASRDGLARAIADRRIVRLLPDQYTSPLHAAGWRPRSLAALRWAGSSSGLAGVSALSAWGAVDSPGTVSLVAPWDSRPRGPAWLRVRRKVSMPGLLDVAGLRVVDPATAVLQAHAELPAGSRAEALYAPMRLGLVSPQDIWDALARTPRLTARRELVARLADAESGAESYLEERGGRSVLRGPDFAGLERQHRIEVDGQRFRIDSFDATTLTAIEFDGERGHSSPAERRKDAIRDALLASVGVLTLRFTYPDVMGRPAWCREVALRTLRARSATPASVLAVPERARLAENQY
ncbi:hypothetical protein QQX10_06080 [Demequina sp. SYSU T00039]|uniref:DUF559 domain-containing protein n=1 Tax=Demequina lignilytica TaxID=3051663 RepID=A0AAW7M4N2_9MICO|nr:MULTISPECIES: hypothetical protein [unclassified Demequina]MDN4477824.1 hypothetical protein [Demequina sp. SYSU T00039-1]MDN4487733.1 hypothetical protein [Demequina sp. SYSU T00039]MDN4490884.1 hypothetical protein [Demequina sp. SYSU T00068]